MNRSWGAGLGMTKEVGGAVNGCGMGRGPVRRRDSLLPRGGSPFGGRGFGDSLSRWVRPTTPVTERPPLARHPPGLLEVREVG